MDPAPDDSEPHVFTLDQKSPRPGWWLPLVLFWAAFFAARILVPALELFVLMLGAVLVAAMLIAKLSASPDSAEFTISPTEVEIESWSDQNWSRLQLRVPLVGCAVAWVEDGDQRYTLTVHQGTRQWVLPQMRCSESDLQQLQDGITEKQRHADELYGDEDAEALALVASLAQPTPSHGS